MSSALIETKCEKCGQIYMAEVDNESGEYFGGCPHCKKEEVNKLFRVLEVVVKTYAFDIEAKDKEEALDKINGSCGGETEDILRCPEYDDEVSRDYQCDDEGD